MAYTIDYGDEVDFDGTLTPPVALAESTVADVERVIVLPEEPSVATITKLVEFGK